MYKCWTNNLLQYLNGIDTLIDVGVGKPKSEAWAINYYYPNTQIVGFEMTPRCFKKVENGYPGLIFNFGIADKDTVYEVYDYYNTGDKRGGYMFNRGKKGLRNLDNVDFRTLNSLDKELNFGNNIFLWADVEGSEIYVLRGAARLFEERRIKWVNLEIWDKPQTTEWTKREDVLNWMNYYGLKNVYNWNHNKQDGHIDMFFKLCK